MKLKARIIFEWTYDADPEAYFTNDPTKAAENETKWIEGGDIFGFLDLCPNEPEIEITAVKSDKGK